MCVRHACFFFFSRRERGVAAGDRHIISLATALPRERSSLSVWNAHSCIQSDTTFSTYFTEKGPTSLFSFQCSEEYASRFVASSTCSMRGVIYFLSPKHERARHRLTLFSRREYVSQNEMCPGCFSSHARQFSGEIFFE